MKQTENILNEDQNNVNKTKNVTNNENTNVNFYYCNQTRNNRSNHLNYNKKNVTIKHERKII